MWKEHMSFRKWNEGDYIFMCDIILKSCCIKCPFEVNWLNIKLFSKYLSKSGLYSKYIFVNLFEIETVNYCFINSYKYTTKTWVFIVSHIKTNKVNHKKLKLKTVQQTRVHYQFFLLFCSTSLKTLNNIRCKNNSLSS